MDKVLRQPVIVACIVAASTLLPSLPLPLAATAIAFRHRLFIRFPSPPLASPPFQFAQFCLPASLLPSRFLIG